MSTAFNGLSQLGNPSGGQRDGGSTQNVAVTNTENPSTFSPADEGHFSTSGVSEKDQKHMVDIIADYRNNWSADRLERLRTWMENVFYWKGIQVIRWDSSSNCYYDALAYSRNNDTDDGEDTDLQRWINPLVLMFCNVFTATMSRAVPEPIIKPRNADPNLKDIITAKAAVEAIRIIRQQNQYRKLNRSIYEMLFLFGCYFRYTRPVIDGKMFGYDEEPVFEDMQIQTGPSFRCPKCGTETPASDPQGMECPSCGAFMGQESYYAAGEGDRTSLKQSGMNKIPRAGVKQTLHSPLEIDCAPTAKGDNPLLMTPILCKETEIDYGEACMMFPNMRGQIEPGAESGTSESASVEKLARQNAVSAMGGMTADSTQTNPTYSETWMRPMSYYRLKDWDFGDRMRKQFPDGLKISMVGPIVVDIRAAVLENEWSHAALYTGQGIYCNALATTAVSFNARFNRVMWILDDWAARASTGLNVADAARIDTEKMSGKPVPAGTIIPIPMRINGEPRPLAECFAHFDLPINPALWNYPQMIMTFCELILGIPRQLSGQGTQDDVETLGGQQLQLARAATTLKPYFENVKDEDAAADQNAIECLKALMKTGAVKEITDVVESNGGAFQNKTIDFAAMEGNVQISADEDQDLPVSPEELRTAVQTMFTELTKGNPAAVAWFDVPANQDMAQSAMVPGSVIPDEAQRLKTENDIQTIIEQGPQVIMNQDGSQGVGLPVHPDKWENFPIAKSILQRKMLENYQWRLEKPMPFMMLGQFYDEMLAMEQSVAQEANARQLKVSQAGSPPPPQPDPMLQSELQQLLQAAQPTLLRLSQLVQLDPMLTGGAKDQIAAGKEILDKTVDAAKLVSGKK